MITREDIEEYYDRVVQDFNQRIIKERTPTPEELAEEDPKIAYLYEWQFKKHAWVPPEVALEMMEQDYNPFDENDVDEFYSEIVKQYVLDIVKEKKKNSKKNIIKFPKRSVTP
jgi:hypothetical protein